jgi:hypothetical protein
MAIRDSFDVDCLFTLLGRRMAEQAAWEMEVNLLVGPNPNGGSFVSLRCLDLSPGVPPEEEEEDPWMKSLLESYSSPRL